MEKLSDKFEESDPRCFDCPLSECNPLNKLCAVKGKKPSAGVKAAVKVDAPAGREPKRSSIDLGVARKHVAWIARNANAWVDRKGHKMVEVRSDDEASLRAAGVTGKLRKSGRRFRLATMNAELHDLVVGEQAKTRAVTDSAAAGPVPADIPAVAVDATMTAPSPHLAYPEKIQIGKKLSTDSILLTIGIILDADERDLVWALWAIQRELERRRS